MKFQTAFGTHRVVDLDTGPESLTIQSSAEECDINSIMSRYAKTGVIEHENRFQGEYGDFLSVNDYHSAMNQVLAANEAFASLPSGIRANFNNSPAEFLAFTQNPDNKDSMIDMGLLKREEAQPTSLEAQLTEGNSPQDTAV